MSWIDIGALEDIPRQGARVVKTAHGCVAVFRTLDDAVFALSDRCAHKAGPLSDGLVHDRKVTCPLHGWNIGLDDGQAVAPDVGGCRKFAVRVDNGMVMLAV